MSFKKYKEWNLDCKVYIGNLSEMTSKLDIENAFSKYGPLKNVWVARNPPGLAFFHLFFIHKFIINQYS